MLRTPVLRPVRRRLPSALLAAWVVAVPLAAQPPQVTTPKQALGFEIGEDYHLATYTQLEAYWHRLASESPRMRLEEIGPTAEGRTQLMAVITSPENMQHLDRYRDIARRLALAEGLTDEQARALAREGKAVVWIDGGLHATEVLGAHQLMELVYQMVSRNDPETLRFLDDVILLAVHCNPDGMELVSNWYMRRTNPVERSTSGIPRLYQKYVGHDNNRDFYMVTQPETANMTRVMFHEWFPEIIYNHHQTGPEGTVLFAPPFRDPFNYNLDPLVPIGIEMVGAAMHQRFIAEDKPGATMRSGSSYSTWWNGGLRTIAYFHNMIGLLTETIGNPTPITIPLVPDDQLPHNDLPFPVAPQPWHFRQSVEYSITADRAVLDYASRYREALLYNIYQMGRNSIRRGSEDHWTIHPTLIDSLKAAARAMRADDRNEQGGGFRSRAAPSELFAKELRQPENRDPRGYILPADQPDFPRATRFVNTLIKNGVTVQRASREFTVNGKTYPAGSYVVQTAQAFRPHVLDMFEPQDHPNDFAYPGGPPIPPYDVAGWTLAYQMGVQFDRILDGFEGPFEPIHGLATPPPGQVVQASGASAFLVSHRVNNAVIATNRLLKAGLEVSWAAEAFTSGGATYPAGTIVVRASGSAQQLLEDIARQLGVSFTGVPEVPTVPTLRIRQPRIGLWDRYGGSQTSGWTRWLLEQYEFPYRVVYPPELDGADLNAQFDVLVFPDGAIPEVDRTGRFGRMPDPQSIPAEYRDRLGSVTVAKTEPRLADFIRNGGTVVTIGSSIALAKNSGLPVSDYLVDENGKHVSREQYYVPGSLLSVKVDTTLPLAFGMPGRVDVFFDNSPVMRLGADAAAKGVAPVAWFDSEHPLVSGWAWGQERLAGGVAMAQADLGQGHLYLFGPEILFRGQPHGTFQFFFNSLLLSRR